MNEATHFMAALRQWLKDTRFTPNQKLPAERELAAKFCVTRAEVRKAFAVLEEEGLIQRFVGRGTFVTPALATAEDEDDLAAKTSPIAAMQARYAIEPELARLAALNAIPAQITEMRALIQEMRAAASWDVYAQLDWRFHNLIAEATGNPLLVEVQRMLNDVRRYVVWGDLETNSEGPESEYHSFAEHERIVNAIERRNGALAVDAMLDHLKATNSQLSDNRTL
ncbi:MAG: FadR/GntR family transcriptional regulator [Pseudomonadota bacterium]